MANIHAIAKKLAGGFGELTTVDYKLRTLIPAIKQNPSFYLNLASGNSRGLPSLNRTFSCFTL
jgi:hypothetical protein